MAENVTIRVKRTGPVRVGLPAYRTPGAAGLDLEAATPGPILLQPGERREMPVVFVVDPALPADIPAVTLSYTFFEVEGAARMAARTEPRE